jgi:hypothetical protein
MSIQFKSTPRIKRKFMRLDILTCYKLLKCLEIFFIIWYVFGTFDLDREVIDIRQLWKVILILNLFDILSSNTRNIFFMIEMWKSCRTLTLVYLKAWGFPANTSRINFFDIPKSLPSALNIFNIVFANNRSIDRKFIQRVYVVCEIFPRLI